MYRYQLNMRYTAAVPPKILLGWCRTLVCVVYISIVLTHSVLLSCRWSGFKVEDVIEVSLQTSRVQASLTLRTLGGSSKLVRTQSLRSQT
jgi:hypothetical protein